MGTDWGSAPTSRQGARLFIIASPDARSFDQDDATSERPLIAAQPDRGGENAAVIARPIHSPGLLRNLPGVSCVIGSIGKLCGTLRASGPPVNLRCSMTAKCVVLNASFSMAQIASGGSVTHRNAARRAQPETSSNQP